MLYKIHKLKRNDDPNVNSFTVILTALMQIRNGSVGTNVGKKKRNISIFSLVFAKHGTRFWFMQRHANVVNIHWWLAVMSMMNLLLPILFSLCLFRWSVYKQQRRLNLHHWDIGIIVFFFLCCLRGGGGCVLHWNIHKRVPTKPPIVEDEWCAFSTPQRIACVTLLFDDIKIGPIKFNSFCFDFFHVFLWCIMREEKEIVKERK